MVPATLKVIGCSVQLLYARLDDHSTLAGGVTGLVEPVDKGQPKHLLIGRTLSQVSPEGEVLLQVLNVSPDPVKIYQDTKLGVFTPSYSICTLTKELLD